jgi:hypothetical protein
MATANDPATENAKKALEQERKISDKSRAEYARLSKGKPTPTQEELDLAALGAHILEHEPDGSDPDPQNQPVHETRHLEADKTQTHARPYQTRSTTASRSHE